jgi:hypothetical protein
MAPLLDLFLELRRRNFPLGVQEYVSALRALAEGFGINSREELALMCQVLWAKSPEEQRQVVEALDAALPRELAPAEIEPLIREVEKALGQREAGVPEPLRVSKPEDAGRVDQQTPGQETKTERETMRRSGAAAGHKAVADFIWSTGAPTGIVGGPRISGYQLNPNLDFAGQLPITQRQMKRAWRYYRRMRRVGQPVELDIGTTIERMYRQGVLLEPALMPRRLNTARLLLLVDAGGSMIPFERITQALIDSAMQSGLAKVSIFYFHDAPKGHLFRSPWLKDHVACEQALGDFYDAGVLIISDGGAARGNLEESRVRITKSFIQLLRRFTQNVAWLNPTPPERWPDTSAGEIRTVTRVPMFTFTRAGLDAAVDVLRGQTN